MLECTPNLTKPNPELDRSISQTQPGQASWALVGGSIQRTCRECSFWQQLPNPYYAKSNLHGPVLKPAPCGQYQHLMNNKRGPGVSHDALACRYFDENQSPPPITKPREAL